MSEISSTPPPDLIHSAIEKSPFISAPESKQVFVSHAFYNVDGYGEKQYLAGKGYETTQKGAILSLDELTPAASEENKFSKEVYIQEKGFGNMPGKIYRFFYSEIENNWVANDGKYTRVLNTTIPLIVDESTKFSFHFPESDLNYSFSVQPHRIFVLNTKDILSEQNIQEDQSSDIIQQYRKQLSQHKNTLQEDNADLEKSTIILNIGAFSEHRPTYKELPSQLSIGVNLARQARHLYAHTLHDREYLLSQGNSQREVKKLLTKCNLKETGHVLIKNDDSEEVMLPKGDFVIGRANNQFAYLNLYTAKQQAEKRGEHVVGTIHTHPVFTDEYIDAIVKKYGSPPDSDPPVNLAENESPLYNLFSTKDARIAPPSTGDLAAAVSWESNNHIVVTQDKLYCLVPTKFANITSDVDEMILIQDRKIQNFQMKYIRAAALRENKNISNEEIEKICLKPVQELCLELGVALYAADWNSRRDPQENVNLKRIA